MAFSFQYRYGANRDFQRANNFLHHIQSENEYPNILWYSICPQSIIQVALDRKEEGREIGIADDARSTSERLSNDEGGNLADVGQGLAN